MDEQTKHDDLDRQEQLPAHESDADVSKTMGAGVMNEGGTAVDRGTGELTN